MTGCTVCTRKSQEYFLASAVYQKFNITLSTASIISQGILLQ